MFMLLGYKCVLCLTYWDDLQTSIFSAFVNSMCKDIFCIVQWLKCIAFRVIAYKMVLKWYKALLSVFSVTGRTYERERYLNGQVK